MFNSESESANCESEIIPREKLLQNADEAFANITGRSGSFNNQYLTASYTNENGKMVDFRLYELPGEEGRLMLYANSGKEEDLEELKQKFEAEGVKIERLGSN